MFSLRPGSNCSGSARREREIGASSSDSFPRDRFAFRLRACLKGKPSGRLQTVLRKSFCCVTLFIFTDQYLANKAALSNSVHIGVR